jgi:hypothetical protein
MTNLPTTCLLTLPLLALLPLAAYAQPPATSYTVAVDCDHAYISQRDAARVLRTDNFSQTYTKRQSLYANVARACKSGAGQVLLVTTDGRREISRPLAAR